MKLHYSESSSRRIYQVPFFFLNGYHTAAYHPRSAILNRITLHSESAHQMHAREIVFEPFDAQYARLNDPTSEPVLLRARKETLEPNAKWYERTVLIYLPFLMKRQYACRLLGSCIRISSQNLFAFIPRRL